MKWQHEAWMDGDTGERYEIKRSPDNRLGCSCAAYRFAPGGMKVCKHVLAYVGATGAPVMLPAHVPTQAMHGVSELVERARRAPAPARASGAVARPAVRATTSDGEEFTVTRGISLRGLRP